MEDLRLNLKVAEGPAGPAGPGPLGPAQAQAAPAVLALREAMCCVGALTQMKLR